MEIRQLEHFIAVASEMSFSRAASNAHVVQSALSMSVGKLEKELGVELFTAPGSRSNSPRPANCSGNTPARSSTVRT